MLSFLQFFFGLIISIVSIPYAIYLAEETPLDYSGNAGLCMVAWVITIIGAFIFLTA